MANISSIFNSGSIYEQLISQVIAVESQPRLKLKAEQSERSVYKGILSDFSSKISTLDTLLQKLQDPLQAPFAARAATVGTGAGFSATASDDAAAGQHEVRVDRLARADARLSKQIATGGTALASFFVDPGDPGDPGGPLGVPPPTPPTPDSMGARSFTVHIAQPEGDPVALDVSYTPAEGATDGDVLAGVAAAVNAAVEAATADGRLADDTGATASVVRETSGISRLSLRSLETGFDNRLSFTDTDGLLAELEVDRTAVRTGTGGGAVYAVGTGPQDSDLTAAFTLDGLTLYRDSNTVDDALDGITFTLSKVTEEAASLSVGADVKGMRSEIEAFIKAYNGLGSFLTAKSKVDPDAGTRGAFAGDATVSGLRFGMRSDLSRQVPGTGDLRGLEDLGITTARDGTLTLSDSAKLGEVLATSPGAVGALFGGEDGLAARLGARLEGFTGTKGTIEQRKKGADARIDRLGAQIKRWDARLERRETLLRDQFARLEQLSTRAQTQQASIASLFYF